MRLTTERLQHIPHAPGVYTFTKRGQPIYVGKAADLRARLAAYRTDAALPHTSPSHREGEKEGVRRQGSNERPWIPLMVREATGLRIEQTNSELEALLLEANHIKAFRPKYNIANRDQKSFLSILVTTNEEFPQVLPTRSHARAGTYFGPFTSAHAVRETLRALRKIFPFRCKAKPVSPERRGGATSPPGRPRRAAPTVRTSRPCLYSHLGLCIGTCAGRITAEEYRRRIITPLRRLLEGKAKSARRLLDPDHRRLLDDVLAHTRVLSVTEKYAADLHDLQRVLHLPSLPARIEGYDISNIHGLEAVGSMVVALDGEPAPSEYKRFKIKTLEGKSNDVGMLREVLARRLAHAPSPTHSPSHGEGELEGVGAHRNSWPSPDLILIDGGKAQLNAALRVLREYSRHSHGICRLASHCIPVVALAKREEEVYLPGERAPLRLPRNSPALHLLQRVRDEAHRFAIRYHRVRYRKRMFGG